MNKMNELKTITISVASGKGGVGKSNLTLNLGYFLYELNKKVLIIDCDLGLANIDVLLGITPKRNIKDLLSEEVRSKDIIVNLESTAHSLDLIPAASGIPELLEYESEVQFILTQKLNDILNAYDFTLLDLGAGIHKSVLTFAASTDVRIIIITPEPTSLTDGYALIKVLKNKYKLNNFFILVNMVQNEKEALVNFKRLCTACKKFLNLEVSYLGFVREDKNLTQSVREQKLLAKIKPHSNFCLDLMEIAKKIVNISKQQVFPGKGLNLWENKGEENE